MWVEIIATVEFLVIILVMCLWFNKKDTADELYMKISFGRMEEEDYRCWPVIEKHRMWGGLTKMLFSEKVLYMKMKDGKYAKVGGLK